jgi:hypothetical protein
MCLLLLAVVVVVAAAAVLVVYYFTQHKLFLVVRLSQSALVVLVTQLLPMVALQA